MTCEDRLDHGLDFSRGIHLEQGVLPRGVELVHLVLEPECILV